MTSLKHVGAAALFAAMAAVPVAHGATLSPFTEFQAMTGTDLGTLQVKLGRVSERRSGHRSFVFRATGQSPDVSIFAPYYRAEFLRQYGGDYRPVISFSASTTELEAMIDSLATLPQFTAGDVDTDGFYSFALAGVRDDTLRVFEKVATQANGKAIVAKLMSTFASNDSAQAELLSYACAYGLLPAGPPTDVTSSFTIRMRGFRKDRTTGEFVGTARLTNTGGTTINGPIIFVFQPPGDVDAVSPSGRTCAVFPHGGPYYTLPIGSSMAPSQSVTLTLRFANEDESPIELSSKRVYAGAGYP